MLEKWYIYYDWERVRVKSERDAVLIALETEFKCQILGFILIAKHSYCFSFTWFKCQILGFIHIFYSFFYMLKISV